MTVQRFQKMIRYIHVMKPVMKIKTTQTIICIFSITCDHLSKIDIDNDFTYQRFNGLYKH